MNQQGTIIPARERELLLLRAKMGDIDALNVLFGSCRPSLYSRALRILGRPQDAEDAVQDAMVAAFTQLHRFEGRSDFRTWATRIVINAALQQIRRGRARPAVPLDNLGNEFSSHTLYEKLRDPRSTPEEQVQEKEHARILKRAMQRLPVERRRAIQICQSKEYSLKEAAKALGLSVCTLKARLHRGRRALVAQLKKEMRGQHRRSLLNSANCSVLQRTDPFL